MLSAPQIVLILLLYKLPKKETIRTAKNKSQAISSAVQNGEPGIFKRLRFQ
ncbi:hypothetical protein N824_20605 [Pedobacter sp. V48]|nr:hypothetical protein N824_20605 [Pedobacter sp. V48]